METPNLPTKGIDPDKAGKAQKYSWGMGVLFVTSLGLLAWSAFIYQSAKETSDYKELYKACSEEKTGIYRELLTRPGGALAPTTGTPLHDSAYIQHIADSIRKIANKELETKEIIKK